MLGSCIRWGVGPVESLRAVLYLSGGLLVVGGLLLLAVAAVAACVGVGGRGGVMLLLSRG